MKIQRTATVRKSINCCEWLYATGLSLIHSQRVVSTSQNTLFPSSYENVSDSFLTLKLRGLIKPQLTNTKTTLIELCLLLKNKDNHNNNIKKLIINYDVCEMSLIRRAIESHFNDVSKILIDICIDLNINLNELKGDIDRCPLHWASDKGNFNIVEYLLIDKKMNVDVEDKNKRSPLFLAVANGHTEITKFLIKNNADVNKTSLIQERTPLYSAIRKNQLETAKILLQNGANINFKDKKHRTPIELAQELEKLAPVNYKPMIDLLTEFKEKRVSCFFKAPQYTQFQPTHRVANEPPGQWNEREHDL